jgi:hypothetical protein
MTEQNPSQAVLHASRFPKSLWGEAVNHIVWLT